VTKPKREKIYEGFLRTGKIKIADCSTATIKIFIKPVHEKTRKDFAGRFRNNSNAATGLLKKRVRS
ncbi:MAG: hypothetical protein LBL66_01610, partial [Clostridiales bacterium]|nr:hypothetical protein [Clostridiales bacterium]